MRYKDDGYTYSVVDIEAKGDDLVCTFIPKRGLGLKRQALVIKDFRETTPCEIIAEYPDMGNHFEDGLIKTYKALGLHLGYMRHYL